MRGVGPTDGRLVVDESSFDFRDLDQARIECGLEQFADALEELNSRFGVVRFSQYIRCRMS